MNEMIYLAVISGGLWTTIGVVWCAVMWYALYRRMLCLIVGVPMGAQPGRTWMETYDV